MDCCPPGSIVHGNLQARILEWVAIFSSRGSSRPRDWTFVSCGSCIAGRFFTSHWGSPLFLIGNARLECCLGVWKRSQSLISLSIGSDDYSFRHIVNLRKWAFWGFLVKVVVGGGRVWSYKAPLHFPYFFITYLRVCYVSRFTCQFLPQLSMITIWKYLITGFKRIIFKFKMFIWKVIMQLNWTEWPTLAAHRKKKRHSQKRY